MKKTDVLSSRLPRIKLNWLLGLFLTGVTLAAVSQLRPPVEEKLASPQLGASYIEIQMALLMHTVEYRETPSGFCQKLQDSIDRTHDLQKKTQGKPNLSAKSNLLLVYLNEVKKYCTAKPNDDTARNLNSAHRLAQELNQALLNS